LVLSNVAKKERRKHQIKVESKINCLRPRKTTFEKGFFILFNIQYSNSHRYSSDKENQKSESLPFFLVEDGADHVVFFK